MPILYSGDRVDYINNRIRMYNGVILAIKLKHVYVQFSNHKEYQWSIAANQEQSPNNALFKELMNSPYNKNGLAINVPIDYLRITTMSFRHAMESYLIFDIIPNFDNERYNALIEDFLRER